MSFLSEPVSLFTSRRQRAFADFTGYIVFSESATDKLTVTKQPVQQGANINDHAYKEPTELNMSIQFSGTSQTLEEIYQELLTLQESRERFTVYTGKRVYESMLITSLGNTTDKQTENVLSINLSMTEIITVEVTPTRVPPRKKQASPGVTGATEKAGKKSALKVLKEGVGSLLGGA